MNPLPAGAAPPRLADFAAAIVAGLTLAGRADGEQMLIAVAVLLIALKPMLHAAGGRVARRLEHRSMA